jgi:hypothetical protein
MSREFGSHRRGYFDEQIETAASDLEGGKDALTRVWAKWFREFEAVAYAIASSEAFDAAPSRAILVTITKLDALQSALDEVRAFCKPYAEVAEDAVQKAIKPSASEQSPT